MHFLISDLHSCTGNSEGVVLVALCWMRFARFTIVCSPSLILLQCSPDPVRHVAITRALRFDCEAMLKTVTHKTFML